jgi:2-keto-3-deoxy-6-phosphogluconate aldolase
MCTGGIDLNNYKQYVELPNVFAVGGSFVLPKEFMNTDDIEGAIKFLRML